MDRVYRFLIVILAVYGSSPGQCRAADTGVKFRVGVSTALTGSAAMYGTGVKNGVILAQKTFDPAGNVEFLFQDDAFQNKEAAANVQKFLNHDRVDALLIFGSGPSLVAAPLAERSNIPLIGLGTADELTRKPYVFRYFASARRENDAVAAEVERRGYSEVAVVTTAHEGMYSLRDEFVKSGKAKVSLSAEVLPGDTDFRTTALRITHARPAAAYLILLPGQPGLFARQLRDLGYKEEIFGAHSFEDRHEVELSKGALLGSWFVSISPISDPSFALRYKQEFGTDPWFTSGYGYDAAKFLIEAAVSHTPVVQHFRSRELFSGALGSYRLEENNAFDVPVTLKRISEAGFEPLH